eukprot:scaffold207872_cov15-Tisochrysis_lutea.AAC.1
MAGAHLEGIQDQLEGIVLQTCRTGRSGVDLSAFHGHLGILTLQSSGRLLPDLHPRQKVLGSNSHLSRTQLTKL